MVAYSSKCQVSSAKSEVMFEKKSNLLSSKDFTKEEILKIMKKAEKMLPYARKEKVSDEMKGKVLATLFYEPSTRTRFSFETAMLRLGGSVISNAQMKETSSAKKGESLSDTGRVVSCFADIIAMRHSEAGSVAELAKGATVPVINAGDGANDHPTQGLLDAFTIFKEFGGVDGLTVGMVGDLKNGRVPHSQCELLKNFKGLKFVFVSPKELAMPREIVNKLKNCGHEVFETVDLDKVIGELDVLACTRIQQERFASENEYLQYKGVYVIDAGLMKLLKKTAIVMHPLPRIDELLPEVDSDLRAKYFEQVTNGVAVRMAAMEMWL